MNGLYIVIFIGLVIAYFIWQEYRKRNIKTLKTALHVIKEERQKIAEEKQAIIDKAAKDGKTIATEDIFKYLNSSSLPADFIEQIKQEYRVKYGDSIPVDEAYKIMTDYEKEYGPIKK